MAKVTFHRQPDGTIIKETKEFGKVEREYVTEEYMNQYETNRNAFGNIGCLVFFLIAFALWRFAG